MAVNVAFVITLTHHCLTADQCSPLRSPLPHYTHHSCHRCFHITLTHRCSHRYAHRCAHRCPHDHCVANCLSFQKRRKGTRCFKLRSPPSMPKCRPLLPNLPRVPSLLLWPPLLLSLPFLLMLAHNSTLMLALAPLTSHISLFLLVTLLSPSLNSAVVVTVLPHTHITHPSRSFSLFYRSHPHSSLPFTLTLALSILSLVLPP